MCDAELQLPAKKKKRKQNRFESETDVTEHNVNAAGDEDYAYTFLLKRVFAHITSHEVSKCVLPLPHLSREGKRTAWTNFQHFCTFCNRPDVHVIQYLQAEMRVHCSCNANGSLVIKARLTINHIQKFCRQYVTMFVICEACRGSTTCLERDSSRRLQYITCQDCFAKRTVQSIRQPCLPQVARKVDEE